VMPKGGMSAEHGAQRFRVGEVPPLAEGYTDRPDTARGILEALVPGASLALVPGSAFAEGPSNWLGACGNSSTAKDPGTVRGSYTLTINATTGGTSPVTGSTTVALQVN